MFTEHEKKGIDRKVKINARLGAINIVEVVKTDMNKHPSKQTIRNILHKSSYKSAYAKKKPYISNKNKKKRL